MNVVAEPTWGPGGAQAPPYPKNSIESKDGGGGEKGKEEEKEGGREMSPPYVMGLASPCELAVLSGYCSHTRLVVFLIKPDCQC